MRMRCRDNPNPGVLPPESHLQRKSYGQWAAAWWQWALALPATAHPLFDTADCSTGQSGEVWFLGGKFCNTGDPNCNGTAVRTCAVPAGKALFFPIVNTECSTAEGNGSSEKEMRDCANSIIDSAANLSAELDGKAFRELGIHQRYRSDSPLFTWTLASHDNVLKATGEPIADGTSSAAVADGVHLMLAPLSPGPHTLHFHGEFPSFNFSLDITYYLTVAAAREQVIATIPVGDGPASLDINQPTDKIYVANRWSSDVSVIDGAKKSTRSGRCRRGA